MKKLLLLLLSLFVIILISLGVYLYLLQNVLGDAKSFEECMNLKNSQKIMSNPPVCTTQKGKTFTGQVQAPPPPPIAPVVEPVKVDSVSALFDSKDNPVKEKIVNGTLVRGGEIDRSYCPLGIYLKDDTGKIQLRVRNSSGNLTFYNDDTNVGKEVQVTGTYPDTEAMCEALTCECDDYIVVKQLELMEIPE